MAQWLDDNLRGQLEQKRDELRGQLADLERVLNGQEVATPKATRVVRAGRKPLSAETRKALSKRMKAIWKARKAKLGEA